LYAGEIVTASTENSLQGARVLVVEDEYFIADDLVRALEDAGAKAVGPAATAEQARALIKAQDVDAAIFDLNLRGVVASGLVQEVAAKKVPCLIVSGYGGEAVPPEIAEIARVEKPVNPKSVVSALATEVARRG
jgi:DNA-binding NtrC family response regulator